MPHYKRDKFYARNDAGAFESIVLNVNIDPYGLFYAYLPEHLHAAASIKWGVTGGKCKVASESYAEFSDRVHQVLSDYLQTSETIEQVIRYNIESHILFAEDADGNVYSNSEVSKRAQSVCLEGKYGGHHPANSCRGGYSLQIGAKAMTKKTIQWGQSKTVTYSGYYGDEEQLNNNPAKMLNSWACISLKEDAKEIPYTDEAAIWFHSLMLGMAKLSKMIQDATFEQKDLLEAIDKTRLLSVFQDIPV